jgi:hypothetical protein
MSLPTGISLTPDGYMLASAGRDKVENQIHLSKNSYTDMYYPITITNMSFITLNFRC